MTDTHSEMSSVLKLYSRGKYKSTAAKIAGIADWQSRPERRALETSFLETPAMACLYAKDVLGHRWPEAEAIIATSPGFACTYANFVIRGRWPEAEAVIATSSPSAVLYAKDVIRGRWPEAEAMILSGEKPARWAYAYAFFVIRGRWPEAEAIIATDADARDAYRKDVIERRCVGRSSFLEEPETYAPNTMNIGEVIPDVIAGDLSMMATRMLPVSHHEEDHDAGVRISLQHVRTLVGQNLGTLSAFFNSTFVGVDPMMKVYVMKPGDPCVRRHVDSDYSVPGVGVATHSVLLTIDNAYSGGETIFEGIKSPHPRLGSLLAFPHSLQHESLPVIHGTKIVIKTDLIS